MSLITTYFFACSKLILSDVCAKFYGDSILLFEVKEHFRENSEIWRILSDTGLSFCPQ